MSTSAQAPAPSSAPRRKPNPELHNEIFSGNEISLDSEMLSKDRDFAFDEPPGPPPPPIPTARDFGEVPQSESVTAFMRRKTARIEAQPWEDFLGLTQEEANAFADVYWSLIVNLIEQGLVRENEDPFFTRGGGARLFVVGYLSQKSPDYYRRDLLVFAPSSVGAVDETARELADSLLGLPWRRVVSVIEEMMDLVKRFAGPSEFALLQRLLNSGPEAFDNFIRTCRPAVVTIFHPEVVLYASLPVAVLHVSPTLKGAYTSAVGCIASNQNGVQGVTVAYHALTCGSASGYVGQNVQVGSFSGTVLSIDIISDSAFVEIKGGVVNIPAKPTTVLITPAPGYGQAASFERANQGTISTAIISSSPTLLLQHAAIQQLVLTQPDAQHSDSGCALIDERGNLVGFCFGGSGITSPIIFSMWIWGRSVFFAHRLS